MKTLTALVGILIITSACFAEIIPIHLTERGGGTKCILDTLSSDHDTIRVKIDGNAGESGLELASITVVLTAIEGATDSFFCTGFPYPMSGDVLIAQWDSTADTFISLDGIIFTADTTKINFTEIPAGSLPIPITFRDSLGVSSYPLNWVDGAQHFPFVLVSESSVGTEGWNPPYSRAWDFEVWLGPDRQAILYFCFTYRFKQ